MPLSPQALLSHLEGLGITTRTVEHPALFTVTQSRELRGELPGGLRQRRCFLLADRAP